MTKKSEGEAKKSQVTSSYPKQQIVKSSKYSLIEKDVLNALLEEDKKYTLEEVAKVLDNFAKKKVK